MSRQHFDAYGEQIRMRRLADEAESETVTPDARDADAQRRQQSRGTSYADRWPNNAIVSLRDDSSVIARVFCWDRAPDRRHFTKLIVVQASASSPMQVGDSCMSWERSFVLGRGTRQERCVHCGQAFRNNHGRLEFCGLCSDTYEPELYVSHTVIR